MATGDLLVLRPGGELALHVGSQHMCEVSVNISPAGKLLPNGRFAGHAFSGASCAVVGPAIPSAVPHLNCPGVLSALKSCSGQKS